MHGDEEIREESAVFLQDSWTASILHKPNVQWCVAGSRKIKDTNEDSLMGTTLRTSATINKCMSVYPKPNAETVQIEEVTTLMQLGAGMDGWPQILHGGIVATIIDEAMGILLSVNGVFHYKNPGRNEGPNKNMSAAGGGSFTAELKITYKSPVKTPGMLVTTCRYGKREGRKDWIYAEVYQHTGSASEGKEVLCATGEALFIARRANL